MEQNTQIIAKKIWNLMRVAFYMVRKGICKRKILLDLNLMMKKGKIAVKTLQKLMFHHYCHQNHQRSSSETCVNAPSHLRYFSTFPPGEYEFRCSNTPFYQHYFSNKKKQNPSLDSFYTPYSSFEELYRTEGVNNMFDMMNLSIIDVEDSPTLSRLGLGLGLGLGSGLGRNSRVKQLRITDSPFSVQSIDDDNIKHVDAAAEDFINKFYSQLKNNKYN